MQNVRVEWCTMQSTQSIIIRFIVIANVLQVTHWPKEDYGKFYDGDSYIILNTYKEKNSEASHWSILLNVYSYIHEILSASLMAKLLHGVYLCMRVCIAFVSTCKSASLS